MTTQPSPSAALTLREFAEHLGRMERFADGPTYPRWKRPFRRWRMHLIGPNGGVVSDTYGHLVTRREAEDLAARFNASPYRPDYRLEAVRVR